MDRNEIIDEKAKGLHEAFHTTPEWTVGDSLVTWISGLLGRVEALETRVKVLGWGPEAASQKADASEAGS